MGFESLSANPLSIVDTLSDEIMAHPVAKDCLQPMGWTSENGVSHSSPLEFLLIRYTVVEDFNISRQDMVRY